jgi:hypothetical protein
MESLLGYVFVMEIWRLNGDRLLDCELSEGN